MTLESTLIPCPELKPVHLVPKGFVGRSMKAATPLGQRETDTVMGWKATHVFWLVENRISDTIFYMGTSSYDRGFYCETSVFFTNDEGEVVKIVKTLEGEINHEKAILAFLKD